MDKKGESWGIIQWAVLILAAVIILPAIGIKIPTFGTASAGGGAAADTTVKVTSDIPAVDSVSVLLQSPEYANPSGAVTDSIAWREVQADGTKGNWQYVNSGTSVSIGPLSQIDIVAGVNATSAWLSSAKTCTVNKNSGTALCKAEVYRNQTISQALMSSTGTALDLTLNTTNQTISAAQTKNVKITLSGTSKRGNYGALFGCDMNNTAFQVAQTGLTIDGVAAVKNTNKPNSYSARTTGGAYNFVGFELPPMIGSVDQVLSLQLTADATRDPQPLTSDSVVCSYMDYDQVFDNIKGDYVKAVEDPDDYSDAGDVNTKVVIPIQ